MDVYRHKVPGHIARDLPEGRGDTKTPEARRTLALLRRCVEA